MKPFQRNMAVVGGISCVAACILLGAHFFSNGFGSRQINWITYSHSDLLLRNQRGEATAVLYFANHMVSADPKGGLISDEVALSLATTKLPIMPADLTSEQFGAWRRVKEDGADAMPALILYSGVIGEKPIVFRPLDSRSDIVSAIERISQRVEE